MNRKASWIIITLVMILSFALAACGTTAAPAVPEVEDASVEDADAPADDAADAPADDVAVEPTELRIAIGAVFLEEAWTTGLLQSLERVIAENTYGLEISYDIIEEFTFADAPRILDQVAATGEYDIVWAHSTFWEAVAPLMEEYPEILWAVAGAGNEPLGKNVYYMEITGYEGAYLIGVLGGLLTENDSIGTVAEYPFPIMNSLINGYFEGAKSVNPDVQTQVAFIESWFDPPKAIESINAQIANGADFVFSQPIGPIEACMDHEVWCAGNYVDQYDLGPDVVLTSNLIKWDPHWNIMIDAWWEHEVNGVAYDAPMEPVMFKLADGGTDIADFHGHEDDIPAEVYEQVMEIRQQLIDGTLVVEFNGEPPQ
jgi:basic membrane protein A and related proteins